MHCGIGTKFLARATWLKEKLMIGTPNLRSVPAQQQTGQVDRGGIFFQVIRYTGRPGHRQTCTQKLSFKLSFVFFACRCISLQQRELKYFSLHFPTFAAADADSHAIHAHIHIFSCARALSPLAHKITRTERRGPATHGSCGKDNKELSKIDDSGYVWEDEWGRGPVYKQSEPSKYYGLKGDLNKMRGKAKPTKFKWVPGDVPITPGLLYLSVSVSVSVSASVAVSFPVSFSVSVSMSVSMSVSVSVSVPAPESFLCLWLWQCRCQCL